MLKLNNSMMAKMQGILTGSTVINIYSGTIPDVTPSYTYSAANYSAQLLANITTVTVLSGNKIKLNNAAGVVLTPTASGTATWFAAYTPSATNAVYLGTITIDAAGPAPMLIDTNPLVSGTNFTIIDLGVNFTV